MLITWPWYDPLVLRLRINMMEFSSWLPCNQAVVVSSGSDPHSRWSWSSDTRVQWGVLAFGSGRRDECPWETFSPFHTQTTGLCHRRQKGSSPWEEPCRALSLSYLCLRWNLMKLNCWHCVPSKHGFWHERSHFWSWIIHLAFTVSILLLLG